MACKFSEEIQKNLETLRGYDGFSINDKKGHVHVSNSEITKLQLGAKCSAKKCWMMVRHRNYWFRVDQQNLWFVKHCYKNGKNIDIWATPIFNNHANIYQIQTSGN